MGTQNEYGKNRQTYSYGYRRHIHIYIYICIYQKVISKPATKQGEVLVVIVFMHKMPIKNVWEKNRYSIEIAWESEIAHT